MILYTGLASHLVAAVCIGSDSLQEKDWNGCVVFIVMLVALTIPAEIRATA